MGSQIMRRLLRSHASEFFSPQSAANPSSSARVFSFFDRTLFSSAAPTPNLIRATLFPGDGIGPEIAESVKEAFGEERCFEREGFRFFLLLGFRLSDLRFSLSLIWVFFNWNSRSFADRLLICERSDAFRLIPRIQVSNFLLDSLLRMEMEPGKLFIGGISWDTNEDRLREYFQTFGEVVEAVIMKDRNTGRARGFGFVVFADPSVAERVVREKHIIDGRTEYGIKGFPTIKVFVPGKPPVDYQGARDVKPIAEYALQQIKGLLKDRLHGKGTGASSEKSEPSASVELNSCNFDELVLKSKELWIVEFFAPW